MRIWLIGHTGCGNRGCEAIVRTAYKQLSANFKDPEIRLYSETPKFDADVLKDLPMEVVGTDPRMSSVLENLQKVSRFRPTRVGPTIKGNLFRKTVGRFVFPILERKLKLPNCIIATGGDMFTLDYNDTVQRQIALANAAKQACVTYVIWGASIGPFTESPPIEQEIKNVLRSASLITVRESVTLEYLTSLGITSNVILVADGAFLLTTKEPSDASRWRANQRPIVGFNVSYLVSRWYNGGDPEGLSSLCAEVVEAIIARGFEVFLIPHVDEPDANSSNKSDWVFLKSIFEKISEKQFCKIVDKEYSAREMKWVISNCKFFIGARTHATIAAISSGVPTIALAYSSKAYGIWRDIFGGDDDVIHVSNLSTAILLERFDSIAARSNSVCSILEEVRKTYTEKAYIGGKKLADLLEVG